MHFKKLAVLEALSKSGVAGLHEERKRLPSGVEVAEAVVCAFPTWFEVENAGGGPNMAKVGGLHLFGPECRLS